MADTYGAKYILVMDDDAYLKDSSVISKLVNTAELDNRIGIVGANVKSLDGHWQMPIRNVDGTFKTDNEIDALGTIDYFEFHGACALFRTNILRLLRFYDESFTIYMNELDLATKVLNNKSLVKFCSSAVAHHIGVGDKNACNKKVYYFIRNYNTVLTRNFRTVMGRFKAVTLHTFMSGGYYAERILFYRTCKTRIKIVPFIVRVGWAYLQSVYRCVLPDQRNTFSGQDVFEKSIYNGFKCCITDRMHWIINKMPTATKGVR
jgi:GT2 family glycosyltransferase